MGQAAGLPRRMRERGPGGGGDPQKSDCTSSTGNSTVPNRPQVPIGDRLSDAQLLEKARKAGDGDAWVTINALCALAPDRTAIVQRRLGPNSWLVEVVFVDQRADGSK